MALSNISRKFGIIRICQFSRDTIVAPAIQTCGVVKNVPCLSESLKICMTRLFNTDKKPKVPGKPTNSNSSENQKQRKPLTSPQITLIQPDDLVTSVSLEHAEKLAKRRNLKLVKIVDFDTKTEKPVFKLMSSLEYFHEETKAKEKKKKEAETAVKDNKIIMISSKISEHDLFIKVTQAIKLLKKKYEVRIFISQDGDPTKAENIADTLKKELKEQAVVSNQVKKMNTLKLFFVPNLTEGKNEENKKEQGKGSTKTKEKEKISGEITN